jgi:hypothetical protein
MVTSRGQPARMSLVVAANRRKTAHLQTKLGLQTGKRKFGGNSEKSVFPCLFVRNRSKSLSKITSRHKLSQQG